MVHGGEEENIEKMEEDMEGKREGRNNERSGYMENELPVNKSIRVPYHISGPYPVATPQIWD